MKRGNAATAGRYKVQGRLGGARTDPRQTETIGAGSDEQNRARAEGFVKMVAAAGEHWPDGWFKGEGFVQPARTPNRTASEETNGESS